MLLPEAEHLCIYHIIRENATSLARALSIIFFELGGIEATATSRTNNIRLYRSCETAAQLPASIKTRTPKNDADLHLPAIQDPVDRDLNQRLESKSLFTSVPGRVSVQTSRVSRRDDV